MEPCPRAVPTHSTLAHQAIQDYAEDVSSPHIPEGQTLLELPAHQAAQGVLSGSFSFTSC